MNNYEAYVYKITVKIIGKIYIGYHKGLFNDSYFNSSEDEQMKKDLSKYDYDIELIATGTKEDMTYLEHKMLKEVDAKNNPMYYNKTNGGSKFLKTDNLDLLYEAVESGEYLKTISEKQRNNKLNMKKYNTFLVFHSGKVIMSGSTSEFMKETYYDFINTIDNSYEQIKETLDT